MRLSAAPESLAPSAPTYARKLYAKKLLDPRWQRRRLEILSRDRWTCQRCQDTEETLHVHHRYYSGSDPWDAPDEALVTLCVSCHSDESETRRPIEAAIVRALAVRFWSYDLQDIADGLERMPTVHISEIVAGALGAALRDPPTMIAIVDQYLAMAPPRDAAYYEAERIGAGIRT